MLSWVMLHWTYALPSEMLIDCIHAPCWGYSIYLLFYMLAWLHLKHPTQCESIILRMAERFVTVNNWTVGDILLRAKRSWSSYQCSTLLKWYSLADFVIEVIRLTWVETDMYLPFNGKRSPNTSFALQLTRYTKRNSDYLILSWYSYFLPASYTFFVTYVTYNCWHQFHTCSL